MDLGINYTRDVNSLQERKQNQILFVRFKIQTLQDAKILLVLRLDISLL